MRAWVWKWSFPRSPLFQNSQSCQISNLAKRKGRNWKMWHQRGNWSVLLYCSNWNMYCLVLFEVIVFLLFFSGQESISHSFAISPIVSERCMDSTPEAWCYCSKQACIKFSPPPLDLLLQSKLIHKFLLLSHQMPWVAPIDFFIWRIKRKLSK